MTTHAIDTRVERPSWAAVHLVWFAAACAVGFATSAIFAGVFRLPRPWFLVPYVAIATGFTLAYARSTGIDLGARFRANLGRGLAAAALISVFLVRNVLAQPGGARAGGGELAFQLVWFGAAYGVVDALLLSVVPMLAIEHALGADGKKLGRTPRLGVDLAILVASMLIAAIYHLGYPEFRSALLWWAIIGNGVITLSGLLGRSALSPVLAHAAMHIAAVLHGPEGTVQLPPHF